MKLPRSIGRFLGCCVLLTFWATVTLAENPKWQYREGGIVRGPTNEHKIALEFTAHTFTEGGTTILATLAKHKIKASFFLTGECLWNPDNKKLVQQIVRRGHYLGPHSDKHPLLCPWDGPKKTLVTKEFFQSDLKRNLAAIERFGVKRDAIKFFIPPYEWYNEEIVAWSREMKIQVCNFTPGTRSTADYTEESDANYVASQLIFDSIVRQEREKGLNGFLLLLHLGVGPKRTDKMYDRLDELLTVLEGRGYQFVRVDELLK